MHFKTAPWCCFARGTLLLFLRFYLKPEMLIKMGKFSCCIHVPGCTSNWRNSPNMKFHTLPTQPKVKKTYVRLIRNATLKKDTLTTRICGAHFPNGENTYPGKPLTGIEPMTFHTLVRCSKHWATKYILAHSSVVRASDQCTEDHRFNTCRGLRHFLCLMLVTCCLLHFSIFQLFPVRSKVYVLLFPNPRAHAMPIQDSVAGKFVCKPHYWFPLADTYVLHVYFWKPCIASLKSTEISR